MGKAAAARKLASAAAFGGGGLSVLGAGLYGVLRAEASLARHAIGNADGATPDSTGWYGRGRPGPAIKVALLGDSSAAGYGVDRAVETTGAHLASGVAAGAGRRGAPPPSPPRGARAPPPATPVAPTPADPPPT